MAGLNVDALYAWMFWLFVSEFPRASATRIVSSLTRLGAGVAFGVGSTLFLANVLLTLDTMSLGATGTLSAALRSLTFAPAEDAALGLRVLPSAIYYPVLISLGLLALPIALVKTRGAAQVERRRVRWFFTFLWGGALVTVVDIVVLTICEACADAVTRAPGTVLNGLLIYVVLLAESIWRRLRRPGSPCRRCATGRTPGSPIRAGQGRDRGGHWPPLRQRGGLYLVAPPAAGVGVARGPAAGRDPTSHDHRAALLRGRHRVLKAIDRVFFRDQDDSRRLLTDLVDLSRSAPTEQALGMLLRGQIDKALHVESVHVFFVSATRTALIESEDRRLSLDADLTLASLLAGASTPLDCEFGPQGSVLGRLPAADREWLEREHVALLVPMLSGDGKLIGLIALGPKKSELPFSGEDCELLSASASAAALALENRLLRSSTPRHWPSLSHSANPDVGHPGCGDAAGRRRGMPALLFPVHDRYGDLPLLQHPDDAGARPVHALGQVPDETSSGGRWHGCRLPGCRPRARETSRHQGTAPDFIALGRCAAPGGPRNGQRRASAPRNHLRRRNMGRPATANSSSSTGTLVSSAHGPVNVDEARRLGVALSDALARAHAAGIIHGDIKPSNIGFTGDDVTEVAGLRRRARRLSHDGASFAHRFSTGDSTTEPVDNMRKDPKSGKDGAFAGTLGYLPPEALRGAAPTPGLDLWALSVVLFQTLAGRNPFGGHTVVETMLLIHDGRLPLLKDLRPDVPATLDHFFAAALARDTASRPQTAAELRQRWMAAMGGAPAAT